MAGPPLEGPLVGPDDDLATVLRSRRSDIEGPVDPFWTDPAVVELVHLVLNCVLYTTSSHFESIIRRSPIARSSKRPKRRKRRSASSRKSHRHPPPGPFSSEDVYHLPGTIPIDQLRQRDAQRADHEGSQLTKRFMVRGHWRRPNPSWNNQRPRWVEPYWKGPDMVAAIERQYRLRGPEPE